MQVGWTDVAVHQADFVDREQSLDRLAQQLEFVEIGPAPAQSDILQQLENGEVTAAEAIERLLE